MFRYFKTSTRLHAKHLLYWYCFWKLLRRLKTHFVRVGHKLPRCILFHIATFWFLPMICFALYFLCIIWSQFQISLDLQTVQNIIFLTNVSELTAISCKLGDVDRTCTSNKCKTYLVGVPIFVQYYFGLKQEDILSSFCRCPDYHASPNLVGLHFSHETLTCLKWNPFASCW